MIDKTCRSLLFHGLEHFFESLFQFYWVFCPVWGVDIHCQCCALYLIFIDYELWAFWYAKYLFRDGADLLKAILLKLWIIFDLFFSFNFVWILFVFFLFFSRVV